MQEFKLDPEVRELLAAYAEAEHAAPGDKPIEQLRAELAAQAAQTVAARPDVGRVEDYQIPGPHREIPLRIYWPKLEGTDQALPIYINFHGSGFVIYSIEEYDHVCRTLCRDAACIVIAVDYCKAPEFKFPKPVDEAWTALLWTAAHAAELGGDPERIAVGGDSAGGCLAAVVAQRAAQAAAPALAFQLLVFPVLNTDLTTASYRRFGAGYVLTTELMDWFFSQYFTDDSERGDPRAAPLLTQDLSGLPPTMIISAGHDPLFSEGLAYAERLRATGIPTEHINFEGAVHGFWSMTGVLAIASEALTVAAHALVRAFGAPPPEVGEASKPCRAT